MPRRWFSTRWMHWRKASCFWPSFNMDMVSELQDCVLTEVPSTCVMFKNCEDATISDIWDCVNRGSF